jgi:hypothetical protein
MEDLGRIEDGIEMIAAVLREISKTLINIEKQLGDLNDSHS